jgi:hypothetical protein
MAKDDVETEDQPSKIIGEVRIEGVSRAMGALKSLKDGARGVLVTIDGDDYSIEEFGDVGDWDHVLGILQAGIAYVQHEMFGERYASKDDDKD